MKNLINNIVSKFFTREVISYLIFGVLTTIVSYVTFWLFDTVFSFHYVLSNVLSWIFAVAFAFITNKLFVFESKSRDMGIIVKEIFTFASARILSLLFETGFIALAVEVFFVNKMLSKIIASVFVVIINYFASKFIIFKKKEK